MVAPHIQAKIDTILQKISPSDLKKAREILSSSYKEKNSSDPIFSNDANKLAYLAVRFPATYTAVTFVLREILDQIPDFHCKTLLDLGSGPATATLAAIELLNPQQVTLIEKNQSAISLGKDLLNHTKATWLCKDLKSVEEFPNADLCIASYTFGEIRGFATVLKRVWDSGSKVIAIIEPGTPTGYQAILEAREFFLSKGGSILAPCPHEKKCPLKEGNWCHFKTRLQRTKLQRFLKGGELGYEDEKFSYLVVSRVKHAHEFSRILRHPFKGSGFVKLNLCTTNGQNIDQTISRKDKDLYKKSRGVSLGSLWPEDKSI